LVTKIDLLTSNESELSCLSPTSSYAAFDVDKLLRMVELYPNDFKDMLEVVMHRQLQSYVRNVRGDPDFAKLTKKI